MGISKKLGELKANQEKIIAKLEASSDKKVEELINELDAKTKELEEMKKYLSFIKMRVKNIGVYGDENLKVTYEIEPVFLNFDSHCDVRVNDTFKAINMLNLISFQDMSILSNSISKMSEELKKQR